VSDPIRSSSVAIASMRAMAADAISAAPVVARGPVLRFFAFYAAASVGDAREISETGGDDSAPSADSDAAAKPGGLVAFYAEDAITRETTPPSRRCWLRAPANWTAPIGVGAALFDLAAAARASHSDGTRVPNGADVLQWRPFPGGGASCEGVGRQWRPLVEPRCVVASVTVLPIRLWGFRRVLRSLLGQTRPPDWVYVALPERIRDRGKRLWQREYPAKLPKFLFQDPRVVVVRYPEAEELGTLDMLLPALRELRRNPPRGCAAPQRVWVVNDDMEYDRGLLEALLACAARHPRAACGSEGVRGYELTVRGLLTFPGLPKMSFEPFLRQGGEIEVNVLQSSGGVLYRTDFFEDDFLWFPPGADEVMLHEADYWFAGYLRARGVRHMHLGLVRGWARPVQSSKLNALSLMWWSHGQNRAKDAVLSYFAARGGGWRASCAGGGRASDPECQFDIADPAWTAAG